MPQADVAPANPQSQSDSARLPRSRGRHRGRGTRPQQRRAEPADNERPQKQSHAAGSTVHKAVEELNGVITTLQKTLGELEDALHLLQTAEEQKDFDEREMESLRRAMRQLKQAGRSDPSRQVA